MRYEDEPVALTHGRWVLDPKTRVMRWHADTVTIAPACPKCGAMPWQACMTRSGKRGNTHRDRKTPQTCICGGQLVRGAANCANCLGWGDGRAA